MLFKLSKSSANDAYFREEHIIEVSHLAPRNHAGRGWGIRNGAMGTVPCALPKIPVLTLDGFLPFGAAAPLADHPAGGPERASPGPSSQYKGVLEYSPRYGTR